MSLDNYKTKTMRNRLSIYKGDKKKKQEKKTEQKKLKLKEAKN